MEGETMFPMTPEDTFRQVKRYQDEQRAQMARDRMARAASRERSTGPSGARRVWSPAPQGLWAAVRQLFHLRVGTRRIAWHRAR
jgi:hypothetical protein